MNKDTLQNRIKFFPAYKKRILESKPTSISRRDQNYIDDSELKKDSVVSDFFEFEKELSELKASNKLNPGDDESR
jgi:hypothetical protein